VKITNETLFSFSPNPAGAQIQIQSDEILDELVIRDIAGSKLID